MVKKGYKQTEIGVIPEDWEVKRLGDIANIIRGASPRPINSSIWFDNKSEIGWVRISDISESNKYLYTTKQNLSVKGIENSRYVPVNNLIMSICATIGKVVITKKNVCIHDGFVYFKKLDFSNEFLFYFLSSIQKYWINTGQIGSQMNLNTDIIKNRQIPIPPKPEQEKIAKVLSDTDELIENLKELITKKEDIKKATMQQLLTGKKRLKGFSGEWVERKLGEVAKIKKGDLITQQNAIDGDIPVIGGGLTPTYFCNISNRKANTITISASGANAGYVNFYSIPIFASDCSTIEEGNRYNIKFIYYLLKHKQKDIFNLQSGGAQPHVYPEQLEKLNVYIPKDITEQKAIAKILSDMDEEIEALKEKLEKTEAIKQGMMQDLLSGRIRLV